MYGVDAFVRGMRGGLEGVTAEYGANMEHDVEWAMDWSLDDEWHTRSDNSWVGEAWNYGMAGGVIEATWDYVDPFGIRHLLGGIDDWIRPVKYAGRVMRRGMGQLHHVLPKYLGRVIGRQSPVLAVLPQNLHQKYHTFVSRGMKKALGCPYINASPRKWKDWIEMQEKAGIPRHISHMKIRTQLRAFTKNSKVIS